MTIRFEVDSVQEHSEEPDNVVTSPLVLDFGQLRILEFQPDSLVAYQVVLVASFQSFPLLVDNQPDSLPVEVHLVDNTACLDPCNIVDSVFVAFLEFQPVFHT